MFEVIYKYLTIVFLIVLIGLLSFTAYLFVVNEVNLDTIFLHKIAGVLLLVVTFIHILIRRKKLKKLTKQFFNIFRGKKVTLDNDMDLLLHMLENKSIKELSSIFNLKEKELNEIFTKNSISYTSNTQILKEVAKQNSYRTFPLIVEIIKYKSI